MRALTVIRRETDSGGRFDNGRRRGGEQDSLLGREQLVAVGIGDEEISYVYALTVYDGKLIAGGRFPTAGGVAANNIASWDGSSWSPLGSGMSIWQCLCPDRVRRETDSGGLFHNGRWRGGEQDSVLGWEQLVAVGVGDEDDYPDVYALTVYDGKLIAGGYFTTAGGVAANRIASWDGSSWSPLGSGMNGYVSCPDRVRRETDSGGRFHDGRWRGGERDSVLGWEQLVAVGVGDECNVRLCPDRVRRETDSGGQFLGQAGGVAANNIASWDGSSWSPLGSGIEGR